MLDRHDLSDEEWARLEPLLPDREPRRGGRWVDHRAVIDGVLWRTRAGAPWRDLPACYGKWKTVDNRHRRWSADGTWARVVDALRRDADRAEGARTGRSGWTRRWCARTSTPPVPATPRRACSCGGGWRP